MERHGFRGTREMLINKSGNNNLLVYGRQKHANLTLTKTEKKKTWQRRSKCIKNIQIP